MCSSPKPRTKVKGKSITSASFLSSMSKESRQRFTERANSAQDRREKNKIAEKAKNLTRKTSVIKSKKTSKTNVDKSYSYWFTTASFKEICVLLFFGQSESSK